MEPVTSVRNGRDASSTWSMSRSPSIFEQRRTRPAADAKFWTPLQTLVVVAAQEPSPLKPPQSCYCGVRDVSSAAFVVAMRKSVISRLVKAIASRF